MPAEAKIEDFERLKERALYFIVLRRGDESKLKIRTKKMLYTIKLKEEQIDQLLKGVKQEIKEM